jgi:hypothetical protein
MEFQKKTASFLVPLIFGSMIFTQLGCQREELNRLDVNSAQHSETLEDDQELETTFDAVETYGCIKATAAQTAVVNQGTAMLAKFMSRCYSATGNSPWCQQVSRPNPASAATFACTYSKSQPAYFIYPDEAKWSNAITAVQLVKELQSLGVKVASIYNWWRPEPYNANVGGAAGRHPYGTAVDVRFVSKEDQAKAHRQLCKWRSQGRLRALGYYSSTALHFGIGDKIANTWGKPCP